MPDNVLPGLGSRLREALERRAWKANQLAAAIDRSPQLVSHWVNDRRIPSVEDVDRVAQTLGISRAWLLGETERDEPASEGTANLRSFEPAAALGQWYFRPAPEDGGRDYGNSNIFATPPDIRTLVRETGQNSCDAEVGGPVQMRFQLIELTKGSIAYRHFLTAIGFDDLRAHIDQASHGRARLATRLRDGLERFDQEDRLVLLRIDDYGTIGLNGDEPTQASAPPDTGSPYAALIRNNLDSSKQSMTAGGSFGLGKAVLWNCSDLSTVLFASRLPDQERKVRVVGKTELTWRALEGRPPYAGPGWFGQPGTLGHSLWIEDDAVLEVIHVNRERLPRRVDRQRASGTSALIVGFRDPEEEGRQDPASVLRKIEREVAQNFFPKLVTGDLEVTVEHIVDGKTLSSGPVAAERYVPEFCDAYLRHLVDEVTEELTDPGDVTRRTFTTRIPGTKPGAEGVTPFEDELDAQYVLVVRLAEDEESSDPQGIRRNRVALVRGRGMVTRFLARDNIVVGARPFDAILLAGEAVGKDAAQLAAEQFLRLAEPPAHDEWMSTPELKGSFRRGSTRALNELWKGITEALREVVRPTTRKGAEGPEELKRLLQLGLTSREAPPATLRNIRSKLVRGAWHVEADVHIKDRKKRLRIAPRLWIDVESGAAIRLRWASLEFQAHGRAESVEESFVVGPNPRGVSFIGRSTTEAEGVIAALCRAKLDLVATHEPDGGGE